jgi:hypothetical protein
MRVFLRSLRPALLVLSGICVLVALGCGADGASAADLRIGDGSPHDAALPGSDAAADGRSDGLVDPDAQQRDATVVDGVASDVQSDAAAGHAIGSTTLTVGSAKVPLVAYYPATATAKDAPVAAGTFPVLVFGHGYQQSPADYAYLWRALVPRGVIVLLHDRFNSTTTINIDVYAADLVAVLSYLAGPGRAKGAFFAGHLEC